MKSKMIRALALGAFLSGCTFTNGTNALGWTAVAAADVEVSVALSTVVYLQGFETQIPNAKGAIQAVGTAIASGATGAATAMLEGSSPLVQTKEAAIAAVLGLAPQLSNLLLSKQSGADAAITLAVDLNNLLLNDLIYVVPAITAANAGTVTESKLETDEAALTAAAAKL